MENQTSVPLTLLGGDRPLPHSMTNEKVVLACAMIDQDCAEQLGALGTATNYRIMHDPRHARILNAVSELVSKKRAVDMVTVLTELERLECLEMAGGAPYLAEVGTSIATPTVFESVLEDVLGDYTRRRVIEFGCRSVQVAYDSNGDIEQVVASMIDELKNVVIDSAPAGSSVAGLIDTVHDSLMEAGKGQGELVGVCTWIPALEDFLRTLKPGSYNLVGARPSIGKTALLTDIAQRVGITRERRRVDIFTLEQPEKALVARMIAQVTGVCTYDIMKNRMTPEQHSQYMDGLAMMRGGNVHIHYNPRMEIKDLRIRMKRLARDDGTELFGVDYAQIVKCSHLKKASKEERVSYVSETLFETAGETNVPTIVLAQVNRGQPVQSSSGRKAEAPPTLDRLRDSGALEQDADTVTLLHRARYLDKANGETQMECQGIVAKHRNGDCGVAEMLYEPKTTRFLSPATEDLPEEF